ncbi:hypothetical protein EYF80_034623 [Liparis tanakae]|uniref:Uncharacterized protein n=1 Tax=Liparis tanakae TaxID=230148 RepID=A0A4Z2GNG2_9TELE|nr:hypothetical protein EYF80_034623 [Liparis tanakae]
MSGGGPDESSVRVALRFPIHSHLSSSSATPPRLLSSRRFPEHLTSASPSFLPRRPLTQDADRAVTSDPVTVVTAGPFKVQGVTAL